MPTWLLDLLFNKYVLGALAIIGVLGAGWWWHTSKVDTAVEVALTAERNRLDALLLKATNRIRELEREHSEKLALIGALYQKEFENAEAIRRRDVAAARDGALRLRVPGTLCPTAPGASTGSAASGGDGAEGGELPPAVAADLLALVHDADRNTRQLAACQAVVREQLETINRIDKE